MSIRAPKSIHEVQEPRPAALDRVAGDAVVDCDVRGELRAGREPFGLIMAARQQVGPAGALCLRAIFEPVPLYAVMQKQGFAHWTEKLADDDWRVWFYPASLDTDAAACACGVPAPAAAAGAALPEPAGDVVLLDVRGLEPPEPMVRTLAALDTLPRGATLIQLNARLPQFLLPQLEQRGFRWEARESDECVRVFIRHADA